HQPAVLQAEMDVDCAAFLIAVFSATQSGLCVSQVLAGIVPLPFESMEAGNRSLRKEKIPRVRI
ncbi:MAG: hypothetical protein P8Y67_05640, partial [Alphaproteobacteria bacterium]